MAERQEHGFKFEDWIKRLFFDIHYTSNWDIPKELNPNKDGGNISIKTAKWKTPIYLGDALSRFRINESFTLVIGFHKQEKNKKQIVKIIEKVISVEDWRGYWGDISEEDLLALDAVIKNREKSYEAVREEAQNLKTEIQPKSAIITLNPKIDSKTQRRLQCSISFQALFETVLQLEAEEDAEFSIWGKKVVPPKL